MEGTEGWILALAADGRRHLFVSMGCIRTDVCLIVVGSSHLCVYRQYVCDRHELGVTQTCCLCSLLCLASVQTCSHVWENTLSGNDGTGLAGPRYNHETT